jgi:probable F420-dependent oxidoreductase
VKINVTLPFDNIDDPEQFLAPEAVAQVAKAAERAGFSAGLVTDHPCPSGRWLDAGGHYAQDPLIMLSLVAAHTTKLRLQTGILVLPYRNPFTVARAVATLDVFSGGRVSLGVGAGYLKGEYKALGVDFERRNEIMDEYLKALKAAWTGEDFDFEGEGYSARGCRIRPVPLQRPHPPLLIGGNARRAIRRAVELGDAWNPFFNSDTVSATARTATMADEDDLEAGILYLREQCEKVGRETPPEIVLASITKVGAPWNPQVVLDTIGTMKALGVTTVAAHIDGATRTEWCDNAERFGAEVIAKVDA